MPGKVVKVNVVAGAEVRERQGIVIVEAMKMENEIPSPIDGIVKEIAVVRGPDRRGRGDAVRGRAAAASVTGPRQVLLDTDIGSDVDDVPAAQVRMARGRRAIPRVRPRRCRRPVPVLPEAPSDHPAGPGRRPDSVEA